MATLEDRIQSIRQYVADYAGRATYIAESGFTQPTSPYCTIKQIDVKHYHHDVAEDLDGFNERVRGLVDLTFGVQAIGGDEPAGTGANKVLHRLIASLTASLPRQQLEADEIGIKEIGNVTDISIVVAGRIENRAVVNLVFSASVLEDFAFDSAIKTNIDLDAGMDPAQQITVPQEPPDCPAGG